MLCREFEDRLNAALDQRANPAADSRLTAHAADCDDCRQLLSAHTALLKGLRRIVTPALADDFSRRVVIAAVAKPRQRASFRRSTKVLPALAACLASAAAMLLALTGIWYARHGGAGLPEKAAPAIPSVVLRRQGTGGLAIVQPGRNRGPAPAGGKLALTGGDLLIEAPRFPGRLRSYCGAIDELTFNLPQAVERLDEVDRFAPGFRPLRVSLSVIWDTLCRTIPGACVDSPPPTRGRTSQWWPEPVRVA